MAAGASASVAVMPPMTGVGGMSTPQAGSGPAASGCKPNASGAADGCCPTGANANVDPDCTPSCGNGALETGETCDPPSSCQSTCTSNDPCLLAKLEGNPMLCTAKCSMSPVMACMSGDKCCPAGCVNATDSDCSKSCGDGTVDKPQETCEPTSKADPCPSSCDDGDPCTTDTATGSAAQCNAACTHTPVTSPKNNDGCCPDNATVGNDNDCEVRCGDGVVSAQETCDPKSSATCPTKSSCVSQGCMEAVFSGSTEKCTAKCDRMTITSKIPGDGCCPKDATADQDSDCNAVCGNKVTEPGEECDIGAPKKPGDQLATGTYDEYSCDARTCKRLYIYTPCSVDTGVDFTSSECGGAGRCNGTICQVNAGCNGEGSCRFSSGRAGACYGNTCFLTCSDSGDCPIGFMCRDATSLGRTCS
jgi:hypothetical protein